MQKNLNEIIAGVSEEVFESLAFVLLAFDPEQTPPEESAELTTASIAFDGPFDGTLVASVSKCLLPEIAANMLGLDFGQTPPNEMQQDAFGELLNVICGNLLPRLGGDDAVFSVRPARILDAELPAELRNTSPAACTNLRLEGGSARLRLFAGVDVPSAKVSSECKDC